MRGSLLRQCPLKVCLLGTRASLSEPTLAQLACCPNRGNAVCPSSSDTHVLWLLLQENIMKAFSDKVPKVVVAAADIVTTAVR